MLCDKFDDESRIESRESFTVTAVIEFICSSSVSISFDGGEENDLCLLCDKFDDERMKDLVPLIDIKVTCKLSASLSFDGDDENDLCLLCDKFDVDSSWLLSALASFDGGDENDPPLLCDKFDDARIKDPLIVLIQAVCRLLRYLVMEAMKTIYL